MAMGWTCTYKLLFGTDSTNLCLKKYTSQFATGKKGVSQQEMSGNVMFLAHILQVRGVY